MLYTGNVNRFIFWLLIPLLIFLYFAFRLIEWNSQDGSVPFSIAEKHIKNLEDISGIDCLILGGSNSLFSISAEQISNESDLNCYNLSLLAEGFSDAAYHRFIEEIPIDKGGVSTIIYSSLYPLSSEGFAGRLQRNKEEVGIDGVRKFSLTGRSFAKYIKKYLDGEDLVPNSQYPVPTSKGDFNFEAFSFCNPNGITTNFSLININNDFRAWVKRNLNFQKQQFSNAEIYFVLPSVFQGNMSDKDLSEFSNQLRFEIEPYDVQYIEQTPFQDVNVLCDAGHHANKIGRVIRTNELLSLLLHRS
jgi:hypothetical protein